MFDILYTDEFAKRYFKLPENIKRKAENQERLFRENPFYPSLHTEKLQPKNREVWSFRINKEYRIIFRFLKNNQVLFLAAGHHHWIYKF